MLCFAITTPNPITQFDNIFFFVLTKLLQNVLLKGCQSCARTRSIVSLRLGAANRFDFRFNCLVYSVVLLLSEGLIFAGCSIMRGVHFDLIKRANKLCWRGTNNPILLQEVNGRINLMRLKLRLAPF